jgi:hypothetical protein
MYCSLFNNTFHYLKLYIVYFSCCLLLPRTYFYHFLSPLRLKTRRWRVFLNRKLSHHISFLKHSALTRDWFTTEICERRKLTLKRTVLIRNWHITDRCGSTVNQSTWNESSNNKVLVFIDTTHYRLQTSYEYFFFRLTKIPSHAEENNFTECSQT